MLRPRDTLRGLLHSISVCTILQNKDCILLWRLRCDMKKFLVSAVTLIHILLINLSMIMIVAMLLLVFANVVLRYVFNSGIYWSEEVALVLEVWFIFLSLGLGVKHRLHISINILKRESVSAWLNKALDLLSDIIFLIVGFVMIVYGGKLVQFTMRSIMPATKWPAGILYLVLPIAGLWSFRSAFSYFRIKHVR